MNTDDNPFLGPILSHEEYLEMSVEQFLSTAELTFAVIKEDLDRKLTILKNFAKEAGIERQTMKVPKSMLSHKQEDKRHEGA